MSAKKFKDRKIQERGLLTFKAKTLTKSEKGLKT
tara:strand:- start:611 stop:712 length:102 start_codon:yes stop_codon:yes gene_type:complete